MPPTSSGRRSRPLQIQIENLRTHAKAKSGAWRETVDEMNAGVRRASALVEQLLRMARLEDGAPPGKRKDSDLKDLVGEVVADHVAIAIRKDVDLGLSISDTFGCRLADLETRLLLANLVDNAVRYSRAAEPSTSSSKGGAMTLSSRSSIPAAVFRTSRCRAYSTGSSVPHHPGSREPDSGWRLPKRSLTGMDFI
jgi:signal transduction histidine kinase